MPEEKKIYDKCAQIRTEKPEYSVDEETIKEITSNFRTLPTFEQTLFDRVFIKHYSLARNERLKCCWQAYLHNIDSRIFAPFKFPGGRNVHFHNYDVRYIPGQNSYEHDNRFKLKPGPGVDYGGQMPIPQESLMKRGVKDGAKGSNQKKTKNARTQT